MVLAAAINLKGRGGLSVPNEEEVRMPQTPSEISKVWTEKDSNSTSLNWNYLSKDLPTFEIFMKTHTAEKTEFAYLTDTNTTKYLLVEDYFLPSHTYTFKVRAKDACKPPPFSPELQYTHT